ncbi:MAG: hypothetical protein JWM51_803 [Microbacteriaceae bacterium]|nr:hypothetical protein [Microbacteriaceae bacterium]
MNLLRLQRGTMASHPVGRIVLLLAMVCATLIGLLAMHTIASATPTHREHATTSTTIGLEAPHNSHQTAESECLECGSSHTTTAMACTLALLVGLLLMVDGRQRLSALVSRTAALFRTLLAHAAVSSIPPPDLNHLSISRT